MWRAIQGGALINPGPRSRLASCFAFAFGWVIAKDVCGSYEICNALCSLASSPRSDSFFSLSALAESIHPLPNCSC